MHKETMKQKPPINLSSSRWLAYATASAASALIGPPCAEGAIHYSGRLNRLFTRFDEHAFPLVPGASISFNHFPAQVFQTYSLYFAGFAGVRMVGGSIAGFPGHTCIYFTAATASNLDAGATIAGQPFTPRDGVLAFDSISFSECSHVHGEFLGGSGYVGFRFDVGNGLQYGWARLRVHNAFTANFELIDYAYADPGEMILVGEKREYDTGGTAEESLGALALGAAGITAWRKWRRR
jgi:hypothetical protein